jgi:hypothetical protein
MSDVYVVLSMHRSGSSAVAGIMHHLGVDMGDDLMPASPDNPKGYFEDMVFVTLNQRIIAGAGGAWWYHSNEFFKRVENVGGFDNEIRDVCFAKSGVWGWKDPRTVATYPLYAPYLDNVHFVVVERGIHAIALSLNRRDNMPVKKGVKFASDYYHRINKLLERYNCPFHRVSYEALVEDTVGTIDDLSGFLEIDGDVPVDFVDERLKHF